MKSLIISTLSAVALSSIAAPAFANEVAAKSVSSTSNINRVTPFALVSSAYQGRLSNQGIPSSGGFLTRVRTNKITAETLVEAAIANRRLEADALQDSSYLKSVERLLESLENR